MQQQLDDLDAANDAGEVQRILSVLVAPVDVGSKFYQVLGYFYRAALHRKH